MNKSVMGVGLAVLLAGGALVYADDAQQGGQQPPAQGQATAQVKPQTLCPVQGERINKKIFVDYDGKRIYFCCKMCPPIFQKNPAKYLKKLEDQGVTLEEAPTKAEGKVSQGQGAAEGTDAPEHPHGQK